MDIVSFFVIILVYVFCFLVFLQNEKLKQDISSLKCDQRESDVRFAVIYVNIDTVIKDIEKVFEGGTKYVDASNYLNQLENIRRVTGLESNDEPLPDPFITKPEDSGDPTNQQ